MTNRCKLMVGTAMVAILGAAAATVVKIVKAKASSKRTDEIDDVKIETTDDEQATETQVAREYLKKESEKTVKIDDAAVSKTTIQESPKKASDEIEDAYKTAYATISETLKKESDEIAKTYANEAAKTTDQLFKTINDLVADHVDDEAAD